MRRFQVTFAIGLLFLLALIAYGGISSNKGGLGVGGGGGAPTDAQYIVSAANGDLSAEDVLTGTANQVTVTNAAGTSTISLPQSIHTAGTPQFARIGLGAAADSANLVQLALGTITTQAAFIGGTGTWNAAGVTFTGLSFAVTDTASAAGSLLANLTVGGNSKFAVQKDGSTRLAASSYLNFGTTFGTTGYGFQDASGQMQFKHSGGSWVDIPSPGISASASLNFGATNPSSCSDLTITATGATDGDTVQLGVPNAALVTAGIFTAWVSAADTVTVRFCNNNTIDAVNPAAGTFNVTVAGPSGVGGGSDVDLENITTDLSFDPESDRSLNVQRRTTSNVAGNYLNVEAGGATSGATNKAGGTLYLLAGIATGSAGSEIEFWSAIADGGSGTADVAAELVGEFDTLGRFVTQRAIIPKAFTLTDAGTIATDASLGNLARVTLGGNRTLGAPTNASDGQVMRWHFKQDATGSRTITLATGAGGFEFGTDITGITLSTTANVYDVMTAEYVSSTNRWRVTGFIKGFTN